MVYPNPAQNTLMLTLPNAPGSTIDIAIYDLSGRIVQNTSLSINTPYIDISGLASGPYLIKAYEAEYQYKPTVFVKSY
jgi:hypothetical protein